jgi:hypothetical protein
MDRRSMGGCVRVCTQERGKMGKPKDTYFVGKFKAENDPNDGFYPVD